jgi:hypothetical protein
VAPEESAEEVWVLLAAALVVSAAEGLEDWAAAEGLAEAVADADADALAEPLGADTL